MRVAVVTGASRGVGRGIAIALGAAGATVYVTGRSQEGGKAHPLGGTVERTAEAVTEAGGRGIAVTCDHSDDDQVRHLFERVADEQQRLDELLDAAADAVEAWARDGTSKAANRFNMFELRPADTTRLAAPGEIDGPPDADGIRRTRTGWRRIRPAGPGPEA